MINKKENKEILHTAPLSKSLGKQTIKQICITLFSYFQNIRSLRLIHEQEIFDILSSTIEPIFDYFDFNLFLIDEDGYFRFVNTHYCTIVGKSRQEIINKHISEVLTSSSVQRYLLERDTILSSGIKYGEKYKKTETYTDHQGNPHLFLTKKTVADPENTYFKSFKLGNKRMFLGTGIDIIDFENTEKDLKCVIEALKKAKKRIEDSLTYAQRIQQAALPSQEYISNCFPDSFVLYKPKDRVSGDFYWFYKTENEIIVAISDCTGHGVPGALLSMLGIAALNDIVKGQHIQDPVRVLEELDNKISRDINTSSEGGENASFDGMEISFCCVDRINKKLTISFAGATAYLVRHNETIVLKGDAFPIGIDPLCREKEPFQSYHFPLEEGNILYMFTDGYGSQFGTNKESSEETEKFQTLNFKKILESNKHLPFEQQKNILEKTLTDRQGKQPQTDDILVFGAKLL